MRRAAEGALLTPTPRAAAADLGDAHAAALLEVLQERTAAEELPPACVEDQNRLMALVLQQRHAQQRRRDGQPAPAIAAPVAATPRQPPAQGGGVDPKGPFRCCGQVFDQWRSLCGHQVQHAGAKRFWCPWPGCDTAYKTSERTNLANHLRTHTGERPFACTWPGCGKAYAARGNLADHVRIHTGEKPFACEKCGTKFAQSGHLSRHQRTCRK